MDEPNPFVPDHDPIAREIEAAYQAGREAGRREGRAEAYREVVTRCRELDKRWGSKFQEDRAWAAEFIADECEDRAKEAEQAGKQEAGE